MGMFDKLKFWKKDEFSEFDKDFGGKELGVPFEGEGEKIKGEFGESMGLGADEMGMEKLSSPDFGQPKQGYSQAQPGGQMENVNIKGPDFGREVPPEVESQPRMQRSVLSQATTVSGYSHDDIILKNLEVISSKIDALKAHIDSVNQRVNNIEKAMERAEMGRQRAW